MKLVMLAVMVVGMLRGEDVFLSRSGKTYHKAASCFALKRSTQVFTADKALAEKNERTACRTCYREKSSAKGLDWAKLVSEKPATTPKAKGK